MADRIIVHLDVPAVSQSYEMQIPVFLPVRELLPLFRTILQEMSDETYVSSGSELLCAKRQNCIMDENRFLPDYGIQNGDHLIFI